MDATAPPVDVARLIAEPPSRVVTREARAAILVLALAGAAVLAWLLSAGGPFRPDYDGPLPPSDAAPAPAAMTGEVGFDWKELVPPPVGDEWQLYDAGDRVLAFGGGAVARTYDGVEWEVIHEDVPEGRITAWQDNVAITEREGSTVTVVTADGERYDSDLGGPVFGATFGPTGLLAVVGPKANILDIVDDVPEMSDGGGWEFEGEVLVLFPAAGGEVRIDLTELGTSRLELETGLLWFFTPRQGWEPVRGAPRVSARPAIIATSGGFLLTDIRGSAFLWSTDGRAWARLVDGGDVPGPLLFTLASSWEHATWSAGVVVSDRDPGGVVEPSATLDQPLEPRELLLVSSEGTRELMGGDGVPGRADDLGATVRVGDGPLGRFRLDTIATGSLQRIPDDTSPTSYPLPAGFGRTSEPGEVLVTGRAVITSLGRPADPRTTQRWWVATPVGAEG